MNKVLLIGRMTRDPELRVLADLRAKSGFSTEQLIYIGRAAGWLVVPSLESL